MLPMIGFSLIIGPVLFAAYLRSHAFSKTVYAASTLLAFIVVLLTLQLFHLQFMLGGATPLAAPLYIAGLFVAPALFLLSGRAVVFPQAPFSRPLLLSFSPCLLPLVLPLNVALPILLLCGAAYAAWLSYVVYTLRQARKQHAFELQFSLSMTILATTTLLSGIALPWVDPFWFYAIYSQAIGFAYVLVVFALVALPNFISDLFELAEARYASSTLSQVNVPEALARLEALMHEQRLYSNENLNLSSTAEAMEMSGHQLSELINRHLDMSFSL